MGTDTENKERQNIGYSSAQEFIDIMEEKRKKEELEIKNKILIYLGLVDKEKSYREYLPHWVDNDCKWDEECQKYYKENLVPLEVSDEEYQKILEYVEDEIEGSTPKSTKWGKRIQATAWIGLISVIIFSIIGLYETDYDWWVYLLMIILILICILPLFYLLVGFSKIVSAAEKYLRK